MCVLSTKVSIRKKSGILFNEPCIYIYIYVCVCVRVCVCVYVCEYKQVLNNLQELICHKHTHNLLVNKSTLFFVLVGYYLNVFIEFQISGKMNAEIF